MDQSTSNLCTCHYVLLIIAQSVVAQKKLYYNVRVHAIQQKAKGACQLLKDKMAVQRTSLLSRIRQLHHCLKWVCVLIVCLLLCLSGVCVVRLPYTFYPIAAV